MIIFLCSNIDFSTNLQLSNRNYQLESFFVHEGETGSGHYFAVVKEGAVFVEYNDRRSKVLGEFQDSTITSFQQQNCTDFFYRLVLVCWRIGVLVCAVRKL